jgi:hypothetical protein
LGIVPNNFQKVDSFKLFLCTQEIFDLVRFNSFVADFFFVLANEVATIDFLLEFVHIYGTVDEATFVAHLDLITLLLLLC